MADLAREEADRYFTSRDHPTSHPEDRDDRSINSSDDHRDPSPEARQSDPGTDDDDDKMATVTATRTAYHLPTQTRYANTGPKGVIADAQSFARAKQSTLRQRLADFAGNFAPSKHISAITEKTRQKRSPSVSDKSVSSDPEDLALSEEDQDSEFMKTWRANRLQELSAQSQSAATPHRQNLPSQRTWGTFYEVDAVGYLDAIEKVSDDTVVVVMIHDPTAAESIEVEDELSMLAYKYNKTRFVRLHHEIAEMETVQIPAVLAYRAGDVFATISGARAEGLEETLTRNRILG